MKIRTLHAYIHSYLPMYWFISSVCHMQGYCTCNRAYYHESITVRYGFLILLAFCPSLMFHQFYKKD